MHTSVDLCNLNLCFKFTSLQNSEDEDEDDDDDDESEEETTTNIVMVSQFYFRYTSPNHGIS